MRNRKRSTSAGGFDSGRFSEVSDIPTKDVSRFIEPRGSYGMNTINELTNKKPVQYRPQTQAKFRGGSYSSEDKSIEEKPKEDSSFASLVLSVLNSENGSVADNDSVDQR